MPAERLAVAPGVWVDARRAAWLEPERTLVVADTHLGYAWVQRRRGHLLPLAAVEDTSRRILELQADYTPETIVFLGDLVHAAVPLPALEAALAETVRALAALSRLVLTRGNHDRAVEHLLGAGNLPLTVVDCTMAGPHRLSHGDISRAAERPLGPRGWDLFGHSHPVAVLSDGIADRVRCPAFLVGDRCLVLPAFSNWAAGVTVTRPDFTVPAGATGRWEGVIVILGNRLLRVPWSRLPR